jgi:hypothetical protein
MESKKSDLEALEKEITELNTKYTTSDTELAPLKTDSTKKEELEKKQQEVYDIAQERAIKYGSKYLIYVQYWLDMEKFAWWSFISSKVMIAAPRATVSFLQNVLPEIKKLDESIKSDTDLTEEICAKLIHGNIEDLDKTLMSEEIEVNEKSVGKKNKDSAENEKKKKLSTKQKGK